MADLTKTVRVLFQGEDSISPTMKSISSSLDKFSGRLEDVADPFSKITEGVLKLDAALIAMVGTGLILAFNASKDFETSTVGLKKILGEEIDQIDNVKESVLGLSNQYGQAAVSIMDSVSDFKRAGFDVADSMMLAKAGIDLVLGATEAELDVARSTEIIISTLKGFNAPAAEAARLTDILNEVSNEYATSVNELGIGMAALAPIAKLAGLSFEETAGVLTPVIEVFRSGDEAAIALKTGLLRLISDQKPVRDALESIGVAQKDSNGQLRSGRDILFDVAKAFQTTDEKSKLFLASELVGIQQAGRLVTVFDSLAKTTEITGVALGSAGSIAKEVNAVLETSQVAVDRFAAAFVNLGIKIGDEFRMASAGAITGATDIEIAMQKIVGTETFKPIFNAINLFSGDLGKTLKTIAENIPEAFEQVDFSELVKAIGGVGSELSGVFDGIDFSTPEGLAQAIQGVVDTVASLATVTEGIADVFVPAFNAVTSLVGAFNDLPEGVKEATGAFLGITSALVAFAGVLAIGGAVLGGINLLAGAFSATGALNAGIAATKVALTSLMAHPAFLAATAGALGFSVGSELRGIFPSIDEFTQKMFRAVDSVVNFSGQSGNVDLGANIEGISEAADTATLKLYAIPERKSVQIAVETNEADWESINSEIDSVSKKFESVSETLTWFDDDGEHTISIPVDSSGIDGAKKQIDDLPTEKQIEIKLQGEFDKDITRIMADAETVQAAFEWTAKLGIANAEADAKKITAVFDGAASSVAALSGSTSDMFGNLLSNYSGLSRGDQTAFTRQVEKEQDSRNEALKSQTKLNDAQAEFMKEKTKAMRNGKALIEIDSTGLEPALEKVMWEILKKVQIRATEESADFLLGLK
ncbi:MAG: phage tail tape measure protein [Proteobacteria bacterium]|nr:phage tail tape measure protein [Desulfobacula sp.]MBU3951020.1 phage tail tape measure protein [Pseudomonadota bacterium]MBU4131588.1 phage tail tape measure protein [Pseudomonadota bacterium]